MPETHHPCGALPVHGWTLGVWFCEHHQAFFATAYGYAERGDAEPAYVTGPGSIEFGPFDQISDVQRWIRQAWEVWLPHVPHP